MTPYNLRRIVGYTGLILLVALLLAGCSFPSTFDSHEHARMVNIHVISLDDSVCANREQAADRAQTMYSDARWLWAYGQDLPDNAPMAKMEIELMAMTRELAERYQKPDPVSQYYCKSKFENIRRATDTMIKASARRPR